MSEREATQFGGNCHLHLALARPGAELAATGALGGETMAHYDFHIDVSAHERPSLDGGQGGTVLQRLGDAPVEAVKGVGRAWAGRLRNRGIVSLSALAGLENASLATIMAEDDSRYPLALRTLTRLLDFRLPELHNADSTAGDIPLYDLVGRSPRELTELLAIDESEAAAIGEVLARAYTALTGRWLSRITLRQLWAGSAASGTAGGRSSA